jgi:hypothetical protein
VFQGANSQPLKRCKRVGGFGFAFEEKIDSPN